jgi:hypothetical protein
MTGTTVKQAARGYHSRPGRPAVVIDDLDRLGGPGGGRIELPHRIFWQPDRNFNLDVPWQLCEAYEAVLREAVSQQELADWLDRDTLVRLWPHLTLPRGVRAAWETRHPRLRPVHAAA